MGLTIEKVREAQKLLNASEVPTEDRGFYFEGNYITKDSSDAIKAEIAKQLGLE